MTTLRSSLIKLAHTNPDLRPHLLPLLKEASQDKQAATLGQLSLWFTNRIFNILKATDPDELIAIPSLLVNLQIIIKSIQQGIGEDPMAAQAFVANLSQAMSRRVKILL